MCLTSCIHRRKVVALRQPRRVKKCKLRRPHCAGLSRASLFKPLLPQGSHLEAIPSQPVSLRVPRVSSPPKKRVPGKDCSESGCADATHCEVPLSNLTPDHYLILLIVNTWRLIVTDTRASFGPAPFPVAQSVTARGRRPASILSLRSTSVGPAP